VDLLIPVFIIATSILLIGKGSDWLTDSLIPVARRLGVSGSFVGLILVSIAVSLPEVLVAIYATAKGHPAISLGIILGSIVCNIGLMTGLSALVAPLKVSRTVILRDGVFSLVVPLLIFAVSTSGTITRLEGLAFLLLFIPYVINVYLYEKLSTVKEKQTHIREVEIELDLAGFNFGKLKPGWFSFVLGLAVLLFGSQLFGDQLIAITGSLGISEVLIGLTIGALIPSIPNIVASYKAARRGMGEIAVAETFGSNIFTLLVTLGISAMLFPLTISSEMLHFNLPAMIVMSFLLLLFTVTKRTITRNEGIALIAGYVCIIIVQVLRTPRY
jgi:cation:H+ antiporter